MTNNNLASLGKHCGRVLIEIRALIDRYVIFLTETLDLKSLFDEIVQNDGMLSRDPLRIFEG